MPSLAMVALVPLLWVVIAIASLAVVAALAFFVGDGGPLGVVAALAYWWWLLSKKTQTRPSPSSHLNCTGGSQSTLPKLEAKVP